MSLLAIVVFLGTLSHRQSSHAVPVIPKSNLSTNSCHFEERSGRFTDSHGASLTLAFELHGIPTEALGFIEKFFGSKIKLGDISMLAKAHAHSSPQMVIRYHHLRKNLQSKTPKWLALELPSDGAFANTTVEFQKIFNQMEQEILRLTKSKDATLKTLLIVFGPQVVAYMHDKRSAKSVQTGGPVKIVGVDNQRSNREQELELRHSKVKVSLTQAHKELITLIQSGEKGAALWDLTDQKLKGINVYSDPHLASEALNQIEKNSIFRSATTDAKIKFLNFKNNIQNLSEVNTLSENEKSRELSARDNGIAQDLLKAMREHEGDGYAAFGSAHRTGVLRELFRNCNLGTKPLERPLAGNK